MRGQGDVAPALEKIDGQRARHDPDEEGLADGPAHNRSREEHGDGTERPQGEQAAAQDDGPAGHQPAGVPSVGHPAHHRPHQPRSPHPHRGRDADGTPAPIGILEYEPLYASKHNAGDGGGDKGPHGARPQHQPAIEERRPGMPAEYVPEKTHPEKTRAIVPAFCNSRAGFPAGGGKSPGARASPLQVTRHFPERPGNHCRR